MTTFGQQDIYTAVVKPQQQLQQQPQYCNPIPPPRDYHTIQVGSACFEKVKYHVNGCDFYKLERPIVYPLNNSQLLRCHASCNAVLFIFEMPPSDVIHLNSLLYQLVRLKDIYRGQVHYLHGSSGKVECFPFDKHTRLFNRFGSAIGRSDYIGIFDGRVAVAVNGLRVLDDFHIFLDFSIYQIKIEEEEEVCETPDYNCIF